MADNAKGKGIGDAAPPKKSGIVRNLFYLSILCLGVVGVLGYLSFEPQSLTDIEGYVEERGIIPPAGRNLAEVLKEAAEKGTSVTITEREINYYLQRTLEFKQEGLLKDHIEAKGVWVRLHDGVVEVILERSISGKRRHTIAMDFRPEQRKDEDGSMHTRVHRKTGLWGKTRVWRGMLFLTSSSFKSLGSAFSEELASLKKIFEIQRMSVKVTAEHIQIDPEK